MQTISEFILDVVSADAEYGDACHATQIWDKVRATRIETDDEISNALFGLIESGHLVEVGKELYELAVPTDAMIIAEETEPRMQRAIREHIESTKATRRGRPWTQKEFVVGHALPHAHR
jgi:hypothetical protein